MSTGVVIILVVVAALILAPVVARPLAPGRRGRGGGRDLRRRFGPEYERAVAQHDGDTKAAEKDLGERLRHHEVLEVRPLTVEAHTQYVAAWAGIQEKLVDSPAQAVADADRLLGGLARDRGFPDDEHDARVTALSVHHPHHVDGFRQIHTAARRASEGGAGTEELREILVRARALFEELAADRTGGEHGRHGGRAGSRAGSTSGAEERAGTGRRGAWWAGPSRRDTTRGSTS
ncbi:hypothetical protein NLX86_16625 [Streptomyces sp. A3M-1-3]|uniref:hypothetical protein n=1 Tax=Streptomyces sp. A3M-1-3 TaxID=2962044 RepID=UPI0020B75F94|nr:hypothetical protein [Streptomyces sp. A3M-1-3]MCP3819665.1 hypothetical protein [Streptomyces sp. A3M-1-3]